MPVGFRFPNASELAPSAVTIGNFDGVHRGHREVFRRLVALSGECGAHPTVLTFDPHPACVVAPERAPRLLSTVQQRIEWINECGIEQVVVLRFNAAFARLTPEQFVERVLVEGAGARLVLVGENFRFGHGQASDKRCCESLARGSAFEWRWREGELPRPPISSTEVRRPVEGGKVSQAGRLLGRPYWLEGAVVAGRGVGRRQTVPTLNLGIEAEVLPAQGVYVTRTRDVDDGRAWRSVTNVGVRPTFGGDCVGIESFLLEGFEPPAPRRIRVEFCLRLREERRFEDAAALKAQILRDARRATTGGRQVGAKTRESKVNR
jgi:riboflavin kinase/FMN adenylyltransferase